SRRCMRADAHASPAGGLRRRRSCSPRTHRREAPVGSRSRRLSRWKPSIAQTSRRPLGCAARIVGVGSARADDGERTGGRGPGAEGRGSLHGTRPLGRCRTLVVGATFQVVAFALIPDFDRTVDRFEWIAAHSARAEVSKTFDLLAVPFLLAGVIVYVLLTRE